MGLAKNMMIKYQERGFGSSDKIICKSCIGDKYLRKIITDANNIDECDYCGVTTNVLPLEELMEHIMSGIFCEYEYAVDCLPYDSREGGYQGNTWDTYDLIYDINEEMEIESDTILNDIIDMIDDGIVWCERDPFTLRKHEDDIYTWNSFCDLLKKKVRFVFYSSIVDTDVIYERYSRPSDILDRIGEGIKELNLISIIEKGTTIYRGRMHNKNEIVDNAKSLGSPPHEFAASNRMNPEGIPMFYGAFDKLTVIYEIFDATKNVATIGAFCNTRELSVIDLSLINKIKIPSLFDVKNYDNRMLIVFLRKFDYEITKRVEYGDNLEYIPTQVVTEYFRHVFRYNGKAIDGIIYNSSAKQNNKCIVLFAENDDCCDTFEKLLYLDHSRIEKINVADIEFSL